MRAAAASLLIALAVLAGCDDDDSATESGTDTTQVAAPKPGSLDLENLEPCVKQPVP